MPKRGNAVHVSTHRRHYVGKDGVERDYETHLLRRSYREDGKVKNETVANLSHLPADLIEMTRASLAGQAFVPAAAAATVARTRPHGHVAAVHAQAKALGLPALLGPAGRDRDIALALIIARVCRPGSKLATTRWWTDPTLAADLGGRRHHRRGVRGDGLARRTTGRHRNQAGPDPPGRGGQPRPAPPGRPVLLPGP